MQEEKNLTEEKIEKSCTAENDLQKKLNEIEKRQKEIEYCAKVTRERMGWVTLFTAITAACALAIAILLFA